MLFFQRGLHGRGSVAIPFDHGIRLADVVMSDAKQRREQVIRN